MALFHLNERPGEPGSALSPVEPSPQQVVGQQTGRQLFSGVGPLCSKPGLPFLVEHFTFFKQVVVINESGAMEVADSHSCQRFFWRCGLLVWFFFFSFLFSFFFRRAKFKCLFRLLNLKSPHPTHTHTHTHTPPKTRPDSQWSSRNLQNKTT